MELLKWVLEAQLATVVGVEWRGNLSIEQSDESKVLPGLEFMILKTAEEGKKLGQWGLG